MSSTTAKHKIPYPTDGDPIYRGAEQMQAMAERIDQVIGSGGGGTGNGNVAPVPNTLALRDANGRTQVTAPAAGADAVNLSWVENKGYATQTYVDQKIQDAEIGGGEGGEGSLTPESVTATANSLALRDANGRTQVATPAAGPDAANRSYVDQTVTGQGFITTEALKGYATETYVNEAVAKSPVPSDVVRQAAVNAIRAEIFGGSTRTQAPECEIRRSTDGVCAGNTDWIMTNAFQAVVDTDNGYYRGSSDCYYTVPVAGRYHIQAQLLHAADAGRAGGAMKILRNGRDVLRHSIASQTCMPSNEGPTMSLSTDYVFSKGDQIRLGYWYSQTVTMLALGFGAAPSKMTIRYVGPR